MTVTSGENFGVSKESLAKRAPLEAVLFDIDGTICDSDLLHYYAFCEKLQEIGYNGGVPITEDFYVTNIVGKHTTAIAMFLFPDHLPRGLKFMEDKESRLASHQLRPVKCLYKLKKWVEVHGLKKAAVSNDTRANAQLMISILGLSDFFHAVILGDECERPKPYPDPYLKALQVLKVSKDHAFICDDSVSGINAGVATGMPVVDLTARSPKHLLLEAKPTFLIKDYDDPKLRTALEELDKKGA